MRSRECLQLGDLACHQMMPMQPTVITGRQPGMAPSCKCPPQDRALEVAPTLAQWTDDRMERKNADPAWVVQKNSARQWCRTTLQPQTEADLTP